MNEVDLPLLGLTLTHDGSAPEVMRSRIAALTRHMLMMHKSHVELKVQHTVEGGMYLRRLFIPRGTLLVGKIHLKTCVNVVEQGDITVLTEYGVARLLPGATGFSGRGIQKVGIAHQDTVFTNIFRTDLTDIAAIEEEIATTAQPLENVEAQAKEILCL